MRLAAKATVAADNSQTNTIVNLQAKLLMRVVPGESELLSSKHWKGRCFVRRCFASAGQRESPRHGFVTCELGEHDHEGDDSKACQQFLLIPLQCHYHKAYWCWYCSAAPHLEWSGCSFLRGHKSADRDVQTSPARNVKLCLSWNDKSAAALLFCSRSSRPCWGCRSGVSR